VEPPAPWWITRPGRVALGALLLFALAYALRLARPLLLPIVLSGLLAVLLAPLVRLLRRLHLPAILAAAIVVAAFTGAAGTVVAMLAEPVTTWIGRAPETMRDLERRLRSVKESVMEARMAAETVEEIARVDDAPPPPEVTVKESSLAARLLETTRAAVLYAGQVVILLFFLLASGETFLRKLVRLQDRLRAKVRVVKITAEIQREFSSYLLAISCINAGLGVATALAMSALGMPNPVLWGVMAAVLNYVPYLGSTVTLVVVSLVAILTFDTVKGALLPPATFLVLATIEGQIITPMVVGRRLSLSPPVVIVTLLVGGWIWGAVGALIAVPVLAMFRIYCTHDEALSPLAELIGHD
jgi:predicted PurR-regulated permease PerM